MATDETKDTRFFEALNRSALTVNQAAAGAGIVGVLGCLAMLAMAGVFFIAESFFVALLLLSLGLLIYAAGADVAKVLMSSFTIFFSSKHLTPKAAQLQETLVALQDAMQLRRDRTGELRAGPLDHTSRIVLPDNALVRDMKDMLDRGKKLEYAEYVAHSYYVGCHELYDHSNSHLDFVAGIMPLFGLMGTVLGLIAMFDSLGSVVTIEAIAPQLAIALKCTLYGALYSAFYKIIASRFEQRLKSLDYDFDTYARALQVLIDNKVSIEVAR